MQNFDSLTIKTFGSTLKEAREKKKLTLDHIHAETKIIKSLLEDMENNYFESFSSEGQLKGFTKSYCKMLGLNEEIMLALLKRDSSKNMTNRIPAKITKSQNKFVNLQKIVSPKVLRTAFLIVSVFAVIGFISFIVIKTFQKPTLKITSPFEISADFSGKLEYSDRSIVINGFTEQGSVVTINDLQLPLNAAYEFKSPVLPLGGEENVISIKARNAVGATSEILLRIVPKEVFISQMNIVLQNTGNSSKAAITVDGVEAFNDLLVSGQVLNLNAISNLVINTNNPENLILKINSIKFPLKQGINTFINTGQEIMTK